jgi:hypothetical protein
VKEAAARRQQEEEQEAERRRQATEAISHRVVEVLCLAAVDARLLYVCSTQSFGVHQ